MSAAFYKNGIKIEKKSRPNGFFRRFTAGLSVLNFLGLGLLCCASFWPESMWWFANFLFVAPLVALFVPTGILTLTTLIMFSRKTLILNILSCMLLLFGVLDFQVPVSFTLPLSNDKLQVRVMTINLGEHIDHELLGSFITKTDPDIIVFQEMSFNLKTYLDGLLPYHKYYTEFTTNMGIASHLPIIRSKQIDRRALDGWGGIITRFDLRSPHGDMFPVFNVHFESPREGIEAILNQKFDGVDNMKHVTSLQEKEAAAAYNWISNSQNFIMAGDFNMTSQNPIYKKYWSQYGNAFLKKGFGFGFTKYTRYHGVRIDHILYDNAWKVKSARVGHELGGDHRAVVADLILSKRAKSQEHKNVLSLKTESHILEGKAKHDILVFEDFEITQGAFENYGNAVKHIDPSTYAAGQSSLRVQIHPSAQALVSGPKFTVWHLKVYPMMRFSYKIPQGTQISMRVKTHFNQWLCIGATRETPCTRGREGEQIDLINDDQWHEAVFNAKQTIQSMLAGIDSIGEFAFFALPAGEKFPEFSLDNFMIYR